MKAFFLSEREHKIKNVYSDKTIENLCRLTSFDTKVYCKDDLIKSPELFKETEYVFSTWGITALSEQEIKAYLPNLKCVFYAAGTVQDFGRPFMNCGVRVFSAWAANAVPVAEYTVAQIVLANKGFYSSSRYMSCGDVDTARSTCGSYIGNYGAKVGIIGAGMIGKLVIKMLKAYNVQVMVFDPFLPDDVANELGVEKVDLNTIFSECNVVSNHLANNEKTKGMLNYELFDSMQPYATFINTGRGAQVVEEDLSQVLKKRPDITAVLDVTYPEPPLPESEFYKLANCILTPHIAGSSGYEVHRMAEYMQKEFELVLKNAKCNYEVTLEMLETMA